MHHSLAIIQGRNDVSIFDFTNLYKSRNACQVLASGGAQLLLAVVGDSLLEPFWPEGTGLGRGLLSVLDTAWLVAGWAQADRRDRAACLEVLREREKLYCLLRQTDPKCRCGYENASDYYSVLRFEPSVEQLEPAPGQPLHHAPVQLQQRPRGAPLQGPRHRGHGDRGPPRPVLALQLMWAGHVYCVFAFCIRKKISQPKLLRQMTFNV